jgi:hypothetical protein
MQRFPKLTPAGVPVTVHASANAPVGRAFHVVAPIDLPRIFRGFGPLPAVVATREQTGAWDHVGATRVVELRDGSEARERLTAYDAPRHFGYRVGPFTGPQRLLVEHADGAWWFAPVGADVTRVVWTYTFRPAGAAARPLVWAVVAPLWRAYARRALALAVIAIERD